MQNIKRAKTNLESKTFGIVKLSRLKENISMAIIVAKKTS
jgi:hypothetical protein